MAVSLCYIYINDKYPPLPQNCLLNYIYYHNGIVVMDPFTLSEVGAKDGIHLTFTFIIFHSCYLVWSFLTSLAIYLSVKTLSPLKRKLPLFLSLLNLFETSSVPDI